MYAKNLKAKTHAFCFEELFGLLVFLLWIAPVSIGHSKAKQNIN